MKQQTKDEEGECVSDSEGGGVIELDYGDHVLGYI